MLMVVLIAVLGVGYIDMISDTATKGYVIADLEDTLHDLQKENQLLSIEVAEYSSMGRVRDRLQKLGMTSADDVEYLTPVGSVATRR